MKILLATANPGKIEEYKYIFQSWENIDLFVPADFGIVDKPEETGETFKENAVLKGRFYCERAGIPSLGDDGGMEIDALGGEPGVKTRRWLGHECTDQELIDHALLRLEGTPREKRGAQFRVVAALVFPDGKILTGEGMQRGYITERQIKKEVIPGYPFRSIFERKDSSIVDASYMWQGHYSHRKEALENIRQQLS